MKTFSLVNHSSMIFFVVFSLLIILFFSWQLYRAKKFTKFKLFIDLEIKPQLVKQITAEFDELRSEVFPNSEIHIEASIAYWTVSRARILQAALEKEVISKDWLEETGNYRHCQHLFYIEKQYLLAPDRIR
ncbi:MAG: hypothetical protein ACSHW0_10175 [Thalassotalea sp.]